MELTDLPNVGPVLAGNLPLAGAVAGVPKKELSPERRGELKAFFDSHK